VAITHLVFDLDDTLYPPGNGLWDDIGERINRYMIDRLGFDPVQVNETRRLYYQKYGTTLRGLMTDCPDLVPEDYLAYVHDVDLGRYLAPEPALAALLSDLPQFKAIFTNSDAPHASRVLACLGLQGLFNAIVDIRAMEYCNKPLPQAYAALLDHLSVPADQCLYIEDSLRNLRPAKALGMTTLLVGGQTVPDEAVDFGAATILEAGALIREITRP
jgi:putative hydrolase of the HAD superfamily